MKLSKTFLMMLGIVMTMAVVMTRPVLADGPNYDHLNPQRDFKLTDHNGETFHLKDHRGKVVVMFFGYLSCPDICPVTLSKLSSVFKKIPDQRDDVMTLFVTVDPERDTPKKMKEYIQYFDVNGIGLTGYPYEVDAVAEAYSAWYEHIRTKSALGYLIDHTSYIYILDQEGRVKHMFRPEDSLTRMSNAIQDLLS